ncbi:hypothetical protein [Nonomuraea basaltis]|uniref:hypothetical protein n=1 Tax=Nonomuraea basaltis TaxID=2495887 RepID=UPI00110C575D|nr:hypothetical protein [Nonomuraea basaltis]TMR90523.1 hypothetical protein EJK15_54755 [Nonomuraea basaltis]
MNRPVVRVLTTTFTAAAAFIALLALYADQLTPATLAVAVALMLFAAATTVHAIVRSAHRRSIDEAYQRGHIRTSRRLTRSR